MNLNDTTRFQQLDPQAMHLQIAALPDQLESAWALGQTLALSDSARRAARIVIAGLDESAIAGEMLAALLADSCKLPISVSRGYDLPAFASGPNSLIILIDHGGEAEEIFSVLEQADAHGAARLVLTSGGVLADYAGAALWRYAHDGPARTAFGWQVGLLLALIDQLGLVPDLAANVAEAAALLRAERDAIGLESPPVQNPAKRLAGQMIDRFPLIYGAGLFIPVARRWKSQLNLTAKVPAFWDELPELDYNTLSGLEGLPESTRLAVVCLASLLFDHPRVRLRQELTRRAFMIEGCVPDTFTARGESALAQVMHAVQFGDYVSYYLAILREVDPTPTPLIDDLKAKLSAIR
jgi:glucose/mannose-6-phosphate isomerase